MSDGTELAPVEFDLSCTVSFEAKDIVRSLTPLQVVKLIKQLDVELNDWSATILLGSYFGSQMTEAPPEEVSKTDEQHVAELEALASEDQEEANDE